jgi:antitoxin CptB
MAARKWDDYRAYALATGNPATMNFSEADFKRMYWHSRRGMLELDLLLVPFAMERLQQLDVSQQEDYQNLLAEEDQDLWVWLQRREAAPSEALRRSIDLILEHNQSKTAP